jgi:spermidine/putrescine transport system permease protein
MLAFTMSLDDFIITHFNKGPGLDTLSTKIYTEVKKGIKPEMYALSSIIFLSVFILLILINSLPNKSKDEQKVKTV